MAAPFAAIESRINAAAFTALSNATADFGGGVTVDGIFDKPYVAAFDVIADSRPIFTCPTASVNSVDVGETVSINSVSYTVASIEPDASGVTVLVLK